MRIGILTSVLHGRPTGVAWHAIRLLEQLSRLDTVNEYLLFYRVDKKDTKSAGPDAEHPWRDYRPASPNFKPVPVVYRKPEPGGRRHKRYLNKVLPGAMKENGLDLVHGPAQSLPAPHGPPQVVTVHDLANARMQFRSAAEQSGFDQRIRESLGWADKVIAVSKFTGQEVVTDYGVPASRVQVIYEGGTLDLPHDPTADEVAEAQHTFQIDRPYVLYVGAIEPRRNLGFLLKGFARMKEALGPEYALVLAGRYDETEYNTLRLQAKNLALTGDVVFTGYQPQQAVAALYAGASAFVLPSLHEGFGLVTLEAMAQGVPVIAAKAGALPEVVGDAGVLVDLGDVAGLARQMEKVLTDGPQALELIQRGRARVRRFSWKRMAEQTLELYTRLGRARASTPDKH